MNFDVSITLASPVVYLPIASTPAGVTQVDILDSTGAVAATSQAAPYNFTLPEGSYTLNASLKDTSGGAIGAVYSQAFDANEAATGTAGYAVPAGATITVTRSAA